MTTRAESSPRAVTIGPLNAVELGNAVGFALPNPALHPVLLIFTAAQLDGLKGAHKLRLASAGSGADAGADFR
jgi:hypothetical protein